MNFDHLEPAKTELFYRRNDPNDVRLGEVVTSNPDEYDRATVVLIGYPVDEGVQRNKGRIGAAQAPDEIRRALYRLVAPDNEKLILFDAGNTIPQDTLEATQSAHTATVKQLLQDSKRVISLGGGNDLAYADCAGLAQVTPNPLVINVDAHFDVRADVIPNSGTPYRQLLESDYVRGNHLFEVGNLPMVNPAIYRDYLLDKGAHIIDLDTLRRDGISTTFESILAHSAEAIFWGLDMDVVHVAEAPGVSAPNALGISAHDFCEIAAIAGRDVRSRIFEISEVNPLYDIDDRTARLAAAAIYQFLTASVVQETGPCPAR